LGLISMSPVGNSITPTISGPEVDGAKMQIGDTPDPNKQFDLPDGIGLNIIPSPQVQLTIGLPKNIDLSFRYVPTLDLDDVGKVDLFGVGAKVEVLPIIFGKKEKLLPFDLAVAVGYTQLTWNIPLEVGS